jgi:glycosyltransferase involved in cell wall biosynthesis
MATWRFTRLNGNEYPTPGHALGTPGLLQFLQALSYTGMLDRRRVRIVSYPTVFSSFRPMRIAQIAPLYESVPPSLYGGTERVVASLCDALTALGHEITLFAAGGSVTRARQIIVREKALRLDPTPLKSEVAAHLNMLHEVRKSARHFDVLHFHTELVHFPFFESEAHRTVTTLHGRLDMEDLPAAYSRWSAYGLVSISDSQRSPLQEGHWLATVPHGLPPEDYTFSTSAQRTYLAFLGRLSPEKRPDLAIRLAQRARIPLRIAAKADDVDDAYLESLGRPIRTDPLIEFIGEINDEQKSEFLGGAIALLFPIHWPEPFGLVMIEAMACGTPVIAWNCGSAAEVIDPGVTGYIVSSEEDALVAIDRITLLDPRRVRATFERRFSAAAMASAYAKVYEDLLSTRRSKGQD